jgi:DNA-binding CsgD family transcriptional regulator
MLVERERETEVLHRVLHDAVAGTGSVVVISGPLGAGKTALLDVAADIAEDAGAEVLSAGATPADRHTEYAVARRLLDNAGSGSPEEGPHAPTRADLLDRTGGAPAVVLVDDLHWADRPSVSWLRYCAREVSRLPLALVCVLRTGDPGAGVPAARELVASAARHLHPAALSPRGVATVIGVDGELASACFEATAGNPLLVRALAHDLALRGGPAEPDQVASGLARRSWWLRERVAGALQTLPRYVRDCLKATVALAEQAGTSLVEHLTAGDPVSVAEACLRLERLGLLLPGEPPRFAAPVLRDVVEDLMTADDHEHFQLGAARVLRDAGFPVTAVADRLLAVPGHQADPDWSVGELHAAADSALQRGEPHRAAEYLRRALLGCPPGGQLRARRLVDLAGVETRFDATAALRHTAQAVETLPSWRERGEALTVLPLTTLCTAPGSRAAGLAVAIGADPDRAPGLDEELDRRLAARRFFTGSEDPAIAAEAVARLDALGAEPPVSTVGERELLAALLYCAVVRGAGSAARLIPLADRVLRCEPAVRRDAYGTTTLALTSLLAAGAPAPAQQWLDSALEVAERDRATAMERSVLLGQQATMLAHLGRRGPARSAAWEALGLAGEGLLGVAEIPVIALAGVAMTVRDERLGGRVLEVCAEQSTRDVGVHLRATVLMVRGALAFRDDPGTALEHFAGCGAALRGAGWENPVLFPWRPWAARVHSVLGDRESALALLREEREHTRSWGTPDALGRALRIEASLLPPEEADPLLDEATTALRTSGNRLGLAKALLDRGKLAGPGSRAEEWLRESHRLAESCRASWLAERVRGTAGWPSPDVPSITALSDAERRVAEFVVRGLTNPEIAAELQVTRRAVEKHLTNCYRKLGVAGRADLSVVPGLGDTDFTEQ